MATNTTTTQRPPIVAVVGHIDHGKSTLLDTIRHTKVTEGEAGGITQHVSAYEVSTTSSEGKDVKITFLDTPGHEAFTAIRKRGVTIADIAILIVAADDGVQPQTKEALKAIREQDLPYIVAINKIDKNNADVERSKQNLLQEEVYLEQFGGSVPCVEISAKDGTGIDDLLEMIGLVAEIQELTGDPDASAEGFILESNRDPQRGVSATLVITNGTLVKGSTVVSGECWTPVRIMEDFTGKPVDEATFSSPVNIVGWNDLPSPGDTWSVCGSKREAEKLTSEERSSKGSSSPTSQNAFADDDLTVIPIIIKSDSIGCIDGLKHELEKVTNEYVSLKILKADVGNVNENDVLYAKTSNNAFIIGFNVGVDNTAKTLAQRDNVEIKTFDIIYDAADWLKEMIQKRTPKQEEKQIIGEARVIKQFSKNKNKMVIGGKVLSGTVKVKESVTIYRQDNEIATGKIVTLQHQKEEVSKVSEGMEFGASVESSANIQAGDILEVFDIIEK